MMGRLLFSRSFPRAWHNLRFYSDLYHDAKLQQIIETSNMAPKKRQLWKDNEDPSKAQGETNDPYKKSNSASIPEAEAGAFIRNSVANSETPTVTHAAADANTKAYFEAATHTDMEATTKGVKTTPNPEHVSPTDNVSPREDVSSTGNISAAQHVSPTKHASLLIEVLNLAESSTAHLRRWKASQIAKLTAALPRVAASINSVTGYDQIEKHKKAVSQVEQEMEEARAQMRRQKQEYEDAIERRSSSQKEINELLTRKHEWTPRDVERFTELYKSDHLNQQQENAGKVQLAEAENRFESLQVQLTSSILNRYHEEQLWSDKIRGASTWGTWMLMGVNVALFAVATFFVEPWKRKRLVTAFEAEVATKLSHFSDEINNLSLSIDAKTGAQAEASPKPEHWEPLYSRIRDAWHWAATSMESLKSWVQSAFLELSKSPNFQFLQSKADVSIYSSLLVFLGWSLGRLSF